MEDRDSASCRKAAFDWLRERIGLRGDILSRAELARGFPWKGEVVYLVGPQGIFKPRQISRYPLSITTTTRGPYRDAFSPDGELLLYAYRGDDPEHRENRGLRDAMRDRIPLIYFHSTLPGRYIAVFPVYIVGDDPALLRFSVAADHLQDALRSSDDADTQIRRGYVTRQVRQRIHQATFRDRVLMAYENRCSICRLRHPDLLDAAHITPDAEELGEPVVSNGLSFCKLHHAAYDRFYFGIRPDRTIIVRQDILDEQDGPMLRHGLKAIHDHEIIVPRRPEDRPEAWRLAQRFEQFREKADRR